MFKEQELNLNNRWLKDNYITKNTISSKNIMIISLSSELNEISNSNER